ADPLNEQGELVCASETTLDAAQLLELYRWLQLTRLVEERLVNLYRQTKVVGGVFRSLGQEATAVGTAYALREQDFISPLIRDLGAVQKLPLIIVAEYNHYAYSTPTSKQTAVANLADKAAGYGLPGYVVDGNDVVACYEVMKRAAEFARGGGGSVLIEAKTYRRKGHAEHDDQRYIPESELERWEERDP